MEVKKFEAPTLQEALETVKRELGPEAIILQTKKNKRGFGLMNKASVEVTAAVSERSMVKKKATESRIGSGATGKYVSMSASQQADLQDEMMDKLLNRAANETRDSVQISASKPRTAIRYAEIDAEEVPVAARTPVGASVAKPGHSFSDSNDEVRALRRMIEDLKAQQEELREKTHTQGATASEVSSFSTPALQEAFDQLVVNGVDKRFALNLIRQASFELGAESSKNLDSVQDQIAEEIIRGIEVVSPLDGITTGTGVPTVMALVGPTGVGKT
ncbi:MAG: hypothetical protein KGQ59_08065, partial [Bdellovibrionales bacterium]|nr:hypothetical protein [Bdellovibrionales bacterium]